MGCGWGYGGSGRKDVDAGARGWGWPGTLVSNARLANGQAEQVRATVWLGAHGRQRRVGGEGMGVVVGGRAVRCGLPCRLGGGGCKDQPWRRVPAAEEESA